MYIRINTIGRALLAAAIVIGVTAGVVSAETRSNKIGYLQQQVQLRLQEKQDLKSQYDELKKSHSLTEQQKLELQKQNEAKDEQINDLNKQLQAKIKANQQSLVAKVAETVVPKVSAQAFSYQSGTLSTAQIQFLGNCESGMNPTTNTGNGFYGAYQFTIPTWNAMGTGFARADLAPLDVQTAAVQKLLSGSSIFTQFPGCASKMVASGLL